MGALYRGIDWLVGLSVAAHDLTLSQICLRAIIVYLLMIGFVRMGKKRFLGRATAFDAILVIIIGSTAARAITGNSAFFGTLAAVLVLIAMHWLISAAVCRWPAIGPLVKGTTTLLVRNGRVDNKTLKSAHMSGDDLAEDLREVGVDEVSVVKEARLERSGKLSVIRK
jgi:uncharacterized membrane protein YcaP (DUF421 family)